MKKRFLSLLLVLCMLLSLLPGTALAAVGELLGNSPAENQSLLEQLESFTGESYEEAYALLDSLGLLDENGNLITDQSIVLDGTEYTLEEMEALLSDPATDLTQVAEVDGVPIALGDLATIVAIERELQRIQETYFSGKTFEGEALENVNSLMAQLQSEGMTLSADTRSTAPLAVFNTSSVQKSGNVSYMAANVAGLTDGQQIQIRIKPVRTDAFNGMPTSAEQITAGFSKDSAGNNKLASATVTLNNDNEVTVSYTLKKSELQNNTLYLFVSPNITASAITVDLKKSDGYKWYSFGTIAACLSFTAAEGCTFQAADGSQSERWNFYHDTNFALPLSMTSTGSTSGLTATQRGSADVRFKLHSHELDVNETFLFLQACKGNGYYNVAIDKDTAVRVKTTATISHTNQYYEGSGKRDNYNLMCDVNNFLGNQNHIQRNNIIENTITGIPINLPANTDGTISFESTIYSVNDLDLNAFVYCMVPYVIISARKDSASSASTVNMANYTTTTKSATFELVNDNTAPKLTITAPGGTYRSGDVIPIKITGDEYIKAANMSTKITINGNPYSLSDLHASSNGKYISLLYEVQEFDSASLTVAIPRGCFTDYWGNQSAEVNGVSVDGVSIRSPLLKNAVTGLDASYDADAQTLGFTISVDQDSRYQTLYSTYQNNKTGAMQLLISVDGKAAVTHPVTMGGSGNTYTFTAQPYAIPRKDAAQSVTVRLQVDNGSGGWETVGRFSASDTVPTVVKVTDVGVNIMGGSTNTNLTLSDTSVPQLQATVTPSNATYKTGVWSSDNPDVATIDKNGQITLTGKAVGEVSFTYTADNGTPEDETDDVTSAPLKFTVTAGDELTLVFPAYAQDSLVREGNSATVKWNTNALVYYPDEEITFTVALYKGGSATGQPVYTGTAVDQAELTIPAEYLTAVYPQSQYTVKVSMASPEPREDTASITVLSPPTVMKITADSTSITDGKTLDLDCAISNTGATGTLSAKRMTENGAAATDAGGCLSATSVTDGDTVTFTPQKVTDGLYDTYTITFTEERNSPDVASSTDSIVITVYRSGALNILVDGEDKDAIDLSNVGKVNGSNGALPTDSAAIIALRQELGLIEYVSINADAYNWSSFSDGIRWVSQNPDAVSVNYRQGGLWDNIKDLPYETYLPNSQMAVSATADGSAVITATHAATGMSDSVTVNVKTLRQQFYLFQVTPAGETQVSYTNGDGKEIKVHTNADGLLALYEPSGIKSDMVFSAGDESNPYLGTILKENLASGEKDAAKLQLYPLNTVTLHPAALAEVYLVKPDGSPYANQTVTLRGGVYMAGRYVEDAQLGNSQNSLQRGDEDATYTTDADGKLTVYMDAAQFVPDGYTGQLTNADLSYWFELSDIGGDRYYPTLVNIEGSMSPDYKLRTGSAVVTLREVPGGEEEQPFLIAQTLSYGKDSGDALRARSVMGSTGKVGPNSTYQYTELTSRVMLWGVEEEKGASTVTMTGEGGFVPAEQSVDVNTFPFASIPIITNTLVLTEETMTTSGWLEAEVPESLTASVYQNGALQKTVTMPFQVVDLTHVPLVDTDAEALVVEMTGSFTGSVGHNDFSFGDNRVGSAFSGDVTNMLSVLNSLQETGSPLFRVLITPSEDSSVFNVLIWGGYNSLDMDDFDYSESGFSTGYSLMEAELDVGVPPLNDLSDMAQGAYDPIGSIDEAQTSRTNSGLDIGAQLEGYYEGQFYYDTDQHKWAFRTISGGMTAGASLSFQANINAWAGPVPITATFAAGIALQLDFKAATVYKDQVDDTSGWTTEALKADSVNDYLTTLRIQGYIDAFGGLGFDYSVLALKIGLYGRLTADSTNTFLSRTYLKDKSQLNGQALGISGEVGVKFYAKFLFVSYEAVIGSGSITYSETFNDYSYIDSYWNGSSADGASLMSMGAPTLLSRAYLTAYANGASQRWITNGTASFDSDAAVVQNDANPGSEPAVNDDGSLSVYISDMDSTDYFASRIKAGSVGTEGSVINEGGFGDMSPSISGSSGFTAAAWVRLFADLDKQSGDTISPAEEKQLLNSTEVMASVYSGGSWTTTRLTDNASPDLAPVTAASGSSAIVFWRSVYASDENKLTDFNTQDVIYFSRYNGSGWGGAQMAYNGSLGSVVGIQTAMLPDGTAILAFTIDKTGAPDATGYEMAYRTVSADGTLGDLVVLTSDSETDTNPQAVAVSEGYFVLGWYSGRSGGDIRLQAVGADGQLYTGSHANAVPESASAIIGESDLAVSADFRFAKGVSQSVNGLTLVWAETEEKAGVPDHSVLYGAQLCEIDGTMYLSSPQALITLPDRTISNTIAPWKDSAGKINAYIFGTWYDPNGTEEIGGIDVPLDTDQLLTGGGSMTASAVSVDQIVVDYQKLQTNAWTPVTFTLRNTGTTKLENLTVTVGTYSSSPVTLFPGESATVLVSYKTGDPITNPTYTISADGAASLVDKTLYLNYNDVGISSMQVVSEGEGQRTVQVTLYNDAAAKLAGSGRTVELCFYADSAYTQPASITVEPQTGVTSSGNKVTLSGDGVLRRMDQGSMTLLVEYNLADYVTNTLDQDEVPAGGVQLYAMAQIRDGGSVMREFATGNNMTSVQLTGAYARTGKVTDLDVSLSNDDVTTATVTLKNNSLQDQQNKGTLVAVLLDQQGKELETKVVTPNTALDCEETQNVTVTFSQLGADVALLYSTAAAGAGLQELSFSSLSVGLSDFVLVEDPEDPNCGNYVCTLADNAPDSTVVTFISGDKVTVNGTEYNRAGSAEVSIPAGDSAITIESGGVTYILNLHRASGGSGYRITVESGQYGKVTSSRTTASSGITVTLTAVPEAGCHLASLTVTDQNGKSVEVEDRGEGKYTFSMPSCSVTVKAVFVPDALPFTDVPAGAWYEEGVRYAYQTGMMNGTSATTFEPETTTSRGMIVTILWRLAGSPAADDPVSFGDVDPSAWYGEAVRWAAGQGIVTGYGDGTFGPNDPITREQLAVMLWRYAEHQEYDVSVGENTNILSYADVGQLGEYAIPAMQWAVGAGIINGTGDGSTLSPLGSATRAQAAVMLMRFCEEYVTW